jgi:hypothetical protein
MNEPLREISLEAFRAELDRAIPCDDPECPTILGGPTDPDLCDDCASLFEKAGVSTTNEQLEFPVDEERPA